MIKAIETEVYRWKIPGMPHRGWDLVDVHDLEEPVHQCEACGFPAIRYVHTIAHPEFRDLEVGCVCCEHLTGDYVNPRKREGELRNKARSFKNRRARWLTKPWRFSQNGNPWLRHDGHVLIVFKNQYGPGWKARIDECICRYEFPTIEAAKLAIFDEIERLRTVKNS